MKLTEWQPGHPVTLVIGEEVWEGVLYRKNRVLTIYVVGELPRGWWYFDPWVYNIDGQPFIVRGYMDRVEELSKDIREKYHPFGNSWILERCTSESYPVMEATIE